MTIQVRHICTYEDKTSPPPPSPLKIHFYPRFITLVVIRYSTIRAAKHSDCFLSSSVSCTFLHSVNHSTATFLTHSVSKHLKFSLDLSHLQFYHGYATHLHINSPHLMTKTSFMRRCRVGQVEGGGECVFFLRAAWTSCCFHGVHGCCSCQEGSNYTQLAGTSPRSVACYIAAERAWQPRAPEGVGV